MQHRKRSSAARFLLAPLALATLPATLVVAEQLPLEEVIVTAQKRAQSIQDVPISITAFSGDFLEENNIQMIREVAQITPNFNIAGSGQPANKRIQIRGIGAAGNNAIEPSVGVFIDGVYYPRPGSVIGLLNDIQTFEVLRGPQGTLFGRNTVAGALNITTRNPHHETEGMVEAGVGDYDAWEVGGMFNGSLSESVAGRVAFKYAERDGYGENAYDGEDFGERDDLVARGKLLFDFNEQFSMLVTADYAEVNSGGPGHELINSTNKAVFEATTTALFGSSPATKDSYDWKINQIHEDEYEDEQWGLSFDINYEFANGLALRSITAVREWDSTNLSQDVRVPAELAPGHSDYYTETLSQEFHLLSPGGETLDWMAGLYYYEEDYDIDLLRDVGESFCDPLMAALAGPGMAAACAAAPQVATVDTFRQELDSIAVFGQATWNINDAWNTTLGLRWTEDQKDGDYIREVPNPASALFNAPEEVLDMEVDDSKTTWFGNVNWYVTEEIMLFATASTGYKSGGFNSASSGRLPLGRERRIFDPEEVTNYELGVKTTLLSGSMTANATLFRMDIDDFQDRAFDGLGFTVINAGELRQQGVEVDINWAPIEPLRIVAGVGYLDSEYLEFEDAPGLPGGGDLQDLTGARRTYSPEWQTSITADWTQAFANGMQWFVGGSWSWVDEQNVGSSSNNDPLSEQDSYSIVNARVGLRSASGKWDVTLFGNNLTDEDVCQTIVIQPFGTAMGAIDRENNTSVMRCVLTAPTTWALRGAYYF